MGDDNDRKGQLALERQLQKAFKTVLSLSDVLRTVSADTDPVVKTVANLLEQYESCAAVDLGSLPLAAEFPDLKGRLLPKIKSEVAEKVKELKEKLGPMREKTEAVRKHQETCCGLLDKYPFCLPLHPLSTTTTTPATNTTTPSLPLADMTEWLHTIDTLLWHQYWSKDHLMEQVMSGEGQVTADSLLPSWTDGDYLLLCTLSDYSTKAEFFLSDKI